MFHKKIKKCNGRCFACLSTGRELTKLGSYSGIFRRLLSEGFINENQTMESLESLELCWECYAFVRKIVKFRNQVKQAASILKIGESHVNNTLSSLTKVKLDDTQNIVFVDATETKIKDENDERVNKSDESEHSDSPFQEHDMNECTSAQSKIKTQVKEYIANRKRSKWAMKRAMQNRKPKFKIVYAKDIKIKDVFRTTRKYSKNTQCFSCKIDFENDIDIMEHYKSDHEKDFACDVCNTLFSSMDQFASHIRTHICIYECSLCKYVCYSEIRSYNHLVKIHRYVYECLKCVMKFVSRREFFQHYKDWHEKFECDYCGISFKMRYCIKDHIRKQHSPIECKQCNKRFARYNGLWLHNKIRHGPPAPAAYCVECDKSFPDVYRYKWHLANSTKHKPRKKVRVPCPECEKVFSKNIYMKDHYNMVHLKLSKYRCGECDKNYIRNADLVKHKRRIHEGILPPKNKICYLCGRGFSTNKILTNHLRTHTGERPFACVACPARFAQRSALVGHVRALHSEGTK